MPRHLISDAHLAKSRIDKFESYIGTAAMYGDLHRHGRKQRGRGARNVQLHLYVSSLELLGARSSV